MVIVYGTMMCLKYTTLVFNILIFLCGLLLIGVSSYNLAHLLPFNHVPTDQYSLMVGLLVLGLVIFSLGFLACCGVWYESFCMLMTYAIAICILLILQLIFAVIGFIFKERIPAFVGDYIRKNFDADHPDTIIRNEIQRRFQCCGSTGPQDMAQKPLPQSCCPGETNCTVANAFQKGCLELAIRSIQKNAAGLFAIAFAFGFFQLVAVLVACRLLPRFNYQPI